jgi:hypothetical protein
MRKKLIIVLSGMAFVCSILSFATYTSRADAERSAYFHEQEVARAKGEPTFAGPYCSPDWHPQFLLRLIFLLGLTFLSVAFLRQPYWPFGFASLAFSMFVYWYLWTQQAIQVNETIPPELLDRIAYRSNAFDVAGFSLLSVIVAGLIRSLCSVGIDTWKRERPLP